MKSVRAKKVVSIRFEEGVLQKIRKRAKRDRCYLSDVIRRAVGIFLLEK